MIYLKSFLFCGFICGVSQYIVEKTKLTIGHINTILVIIGCMLSGFKIYDKLIDIFNAGATIPIMNFGHLLVSGSSSLYDKYGFIGLFKGIFENSGAGISITIVCAFIITIFFKVKH